MKFLKILWIWTIITSFIAITYADYKTIVTSVLNDIQTTNTNKTDLQKRQNFQNYIPKIQKLTVVDKRVRDALITYLNAKIAELDTTLKTTTYESNITNIDKAVIEKTWLERHNTERNNLDLATYTISPELNNTAQNRANHLAEINSSTHKRLSTDGYYNYESIKSWFSDLWVNFPKEQNGAANFSENIAYRLNYSCKTDDCTEYLTTRIKDWFDFFMSEKKAKWPHYRAIISPQFTKIGVGIATNLSTKKIFIVTHYSVDF